MFYLSLFKNKLARIEPLLQVMKKGYYSDLRTISRKSDLMLAPPTKAPSMSG